MRIWESFKREDIKSSLEDISVSAGVPPEYGVSDGAHNLVGGFKDAGICHHFDISHTLGNRMKHVYGKNPEFMSLTEKIGKIRLQYHLTDKAWLLPLNMRAIARFMNLCDRVEWAEKLPGCYDSPEKDMKDAYAFILSYREPVQELSVCTDVIRHVEKLCKCQGFGVRTNALCQDYIIRKVIGEANNRRACVGLEMLEVIFCISAFSILIVSINLGISGSIYPQLGMLRELKITYFGLGLDLRLSIRFLLY